MLVSIIIALKKENPYFIECIEHCNKLTYSNYEIIVLPDEPLTTNYQLPTIKIIPTGNVTPAEKRDIGIKYAKGEIIAFIDDDAYPDKNWLTNAIPLFNNEEVAAVCGPAITPNEDNIYQKASGFVFESYLASGKYNYRYRKAKTREVDDYPSCNFLVRKSIIEKIGGFKNTFWPGEDTVLCLKIIELNKKIIYSPSVLVYHHRRPLFKPHIQQVARYGLHRGYFVKKFPKTSFRLSYFIPSVFTITLLILCIGAFFCKYSLYTLFLLLSIYFLMLIISTVKLKSLRIIILTIAGIFITHIVYGVSFLQGLASKNLKK
jgi:cellulose synthase/poly-beta-1,6-N-acetylglucosamine synthase-like glycosyltransferase